MPEDTQRFVAEPDHFNFEDDDAGEPEPTKRYAAWNESQHSRANDGKFGSGGGSSGGGAGAGGAAKPAAKLSNFDFVKAALERHNNRSVTPGAPLAPHQQHGAKHIDHNAYPESLKSKGEAELRFIAKDAKEAHDAMPDGPNAGYYLDEINYVSSEIHRRRNPTQYSRGQQHPTVAQALRRLID